VRACVHACVWTIRRRISLLHQPSQMRHITWDTHTQTQDPSINLEAAVNVLHNHKKQRASVNTGLQSGHNPHAPCPTFISLSRPLIIMKSSGHNPPKPCPGVRGTSRAHQGIYNFAVTSLFVLFNGLVPRLKLLSTSLVMW
jgi:hypothetical protein